MESIILALIITIALLFIVFKVKKSIEGFTKTEFEKDCSACGSCCISDCKSKNK